ncbi:MAG: GTPase HflX [Myxococcota bacterium]
MAEISRDLRRQVGVLVDRRGRIQHVVVGDARKLFLPDLGRQRAGRSRFRGLRLLHTHIGGEPITRDDLTDLSLLQLDLIGVIQADRDGQAESLELAHLVPPSPSEELWEILSPEPVHEVEAGLDFLAFIEDLESQFAAYRGQLVEAAGTGKTLAVAVHLATGAPGEPDIAESLAELRELARTADVQIVETLVQKRRKVDPRYVIGRGKLDQLVLASMQRGADLIIFDRDLNPGQARSIAEVTDAKVIDRTQLILDIFAQHATTRDGKLQVELAQLEYSLPRLSGSGTAMSRLAGGIGGRGPGETKLEIDRRRAKDRITKLQKQAKKLGKQRQNRRSRRVQSDVPVAAIVGYTNAGKSTLLNALTGSDVQVEDKLFATLDPTSRRMRFPDETELVLTDTVGFIRDLPEDLVAAFKATLEELGDADILVHVVDVSTPGWEDRMEAVDRVLRDLDVGDKERVVVFNKVDRYDAEESLDAICRRHEALATSAIDRNTLTGLTEKLTEVLHAWPASRRAAEEAEAAWVS